MKMLIKASIWSGKILIAAAAASVILAWMSAYRDVKIQRTVDEKYANTPAAAIPREELPFNGNSTILGFAALGWYWNALVLGVLAIAMRTSAASDCDCCGSECCNETIEKE